MTDFISVLVVFCFCSAFVFDAFLVFISLHLNPVNCQAWLHTPWSHRISNFDFSGWFYGPEYICSQSFLQVSVRDCAPFLLQWPVGLHFGSSVVFPHKLNTSVSVFSRVD